MFSRNSARAARWAVNVVFSFIAAYVVVIIALPMLNR